MRGAPLPPAQDPPAVELRKSEALSGTGCGCERQAVFSGPLLGRMSWRRKTESIARPRKGKDRASLYGEPQDPAKNPGLSEEHVSGRQDVYMERLTAMTKVPPATQHFRVHAGLTAGTTAAHLPGGRPQAAPTKKRGLGPQLDPHRRVPGLHPETSLSTPGMHACARAPGWGWTLGWPCWESLSLSLFFPLPLLLMEEINF